MALQNMHNTYYECIMHVHKEIIPAEIEDCNNRPFILKYIHCSKGISSSHM